MTILSSTFNLSNNVKYINAKVDTTPSGGGALTGTASTQDKKDLMHVILRAISTNIDDTASNPKSKTLGWQRFGSEDSAGDVVQGTAATFDDGSVYGFLRARCYDYGDTARTGGATNDHYKYLRLRLFERDDTTLPANEFDSADRSVARYATSNNVLVLRWDMYSDWNSAVLTNMLDSSGAYNDSDAINGGVGIADADGFGKSSGDLAYEAENEAWNFTRFGGNNKINKFVNSNNGTTKASGNDPIIASRNNTNGEYPRGNSILYDMYYDRYGQTGFGHSDVSYKVQHQELTFNIDGNFTMWLFGDQDNVGTNLDSLSANAIAADRAYQQVDSSAPARYLCMFATQMQDQDPELNGPYNTVLMATEYKKEFGEAAPTNDFIHNGTVFTANSLLMNNGMATPNSFNALEGYSVGQGNNTNTGTIQTFNAGSSTAVHQTGPLQHGTKFRNTDGGMTNNNSTTNIRDQLDGGQVAFNNSNSAVNMLEPNAHLPRDFQDTNTVGYGQHGDNVNTLSNVMSTNADNNARVERSGNILMGLSNSHHSEDTSNVTNQTRRNASYGVASNSSHSNVRDRNLGNYKVQNNTGAKTNAHGGSTYADWDNNTNGARGINADANASNLAYDGTGLSAAKEIRWYGADGAQFMLTEYPAREAGASTLRGDTNSDNQALETAESINTFNAYGTPQSGREYLAATRLHMGWLGYVGHQNSQTCYSLNEIFFGSRHGLFGDNKGLQPIGALSEHIPGKSDLGRPISYGSSIPMVNNMLDNSGADVTENEDKPREMFEEFHPTPEQQVNYSVYEPILSVGTSKLSAGGIYSGFVDGGAYRTHANDNNTFFANTNGSFTSTSSNSPAHIDLIAEMGNPGGTAKKLSAFAMLGRCFGMKIFGPYRHHKYNYLDAVSIQVDDDGFYAVNPTNSVEHWIVPMNHTQCALLLKK